MTKTEKLYCLGYNKMMEHHQSIRPIYDGQFSDAQLNQKNHNHFKIQ